MMRRDIQAICVKPGEVVMFTNTCLHSGDVNNSKEFSLRLFAYLVSNSYDFPSNKIMLNEWTDTTENTKIASVAQTSERVKMKRSRESKINRRQSEGHARHDARVSCQTDRYGFL